LTPGVRKAAFSAVRTAGLELFRMHEIQVTSSRFSTTDWNWTKLTSRVLSTGDEGMKKSRYTEEQIGFALRQAEGGTPVADVCRQMGVSEASFYV